MDKHVSVIIPAYNAAGFLEETLRSLLAASFAGHEIILIDDGSTDNTLQIASSFGGRVRCISQSNQGESVARNRGIQEARGEYLVFLDADDILDEEMIPSALEALAGHPGARVAYGYRKNFSREISEHGGRNESPARSGTIFEEIIRGRTLVPGQFLIAKECLEKTGGFSEDIRFGEDWEFLLKLSYHFEFVFVPGVFVHKRVHQAMQSFSKDRADIVERRKEVIRRAFPSEGEGMIGKYLNRETVADWYRSFALSFGAGSEKGREYMRKSLASWPFQPRAAAWVIYWSLPERFRRALKRLKSGDEA